jgi:phage terminase large subunit GpA-like protein
MDDFANNAIRDIAVQCTAQNAKTQTVMNCTCWAIADDPASAMWVTATKDELRDFLRDRLTPTVEECPSVKARMAETTLTSFTFGGMPFGEA